MDNAFRIVSKFRRASIPMHMQTATISIKH